MLSRSHVFPFVRRDGATMLVNYLADPDGRVSGLLDHLCRLVRRLEGWRRVCVVEALRRQERRVRDVARLSGIAKALLDLCLFVPAGGYVSLTGSAGRGLSCARPALAAGSL